MKPESAVSLEQTLTSLLSEQYSPEDVNRILEGYRAERPVTLRVNTLKSTPAQVQQALKDAGISFREVSWNPEALILEQVREKELQRLPLYQQGEIYLQSLSSMIPPLVLMPQERESILDMAAAPGGKTTQIAAMTRNQASITACEKNKIRADRLKYNLEKQGAARVCVMVTDARKLDDFFAFDRILLDAPCSGSGTISLIPENFGAQSFSMALVAQCVQAQQALLRKALRLLKPGCEMVYSTCSILARENEQILSSILPKCGAELVPLGGDLFRSMPLLPTSLPGTICICPDSLYEGFFLAKIRKLPSGKSHR